MTRRKSKQETGHRKQETGKEGLGKKPTNIKENVSFLKNVGKNPRILIRANKRGGFWKPPMTHIPNRTH